MESMRATGAKPGGATRTCAAAGTRKDPRRAPASVTSVSEPRRLPEKVEDADPRRLPPAPAVPAPWIASWTLEKELARPRAHVRRARAAGREECKAAVMSLGGEGRGGGAERDRCSMAMRRLATSSSEMMLASDILRTGRPSFRASGCSSHDRVTRSVCTSGAGEP